MHNAAPCILRYCNARSQVHRRLKRWRGWTSVGIERKLDGNPKGWRASDALVTWRVHGQQIPGTKLVYVVDCFAVTKHLLYEYFGIGLVPADHAVKATKT